MVFKNVDEWFEKGPEGMKEEFKDTYIYLFESAKKYAISMNENAKDKAGVTLKIKISEQLLKQSLIDAFDDLRRLTDYHPTPVPNPIKKMSYIVYWLIRRKPIILDSEDIVKSEKLSDMARTRFLFINEEFGVKLLINAAFTGKKEKKICEHVREEAVKQLKYYKHFLLYYLIYRMDSPKALEAMILGCTIHPIWEVDKVIWSEPKETK